MVQEAIKEKENMKKKQKSQKLIPWKFALAAAIIIATIVFLLTLLAASETFGALQSLTYIITTIYGSIGYSVTFLGAFLGTIYIFVDSFIITFIFAWLYNKLLK